MKWFEKSTLTYAGRIDPGGNNRGCDPLMRQRSQAATSQGSPRAGIRIWLALLCVLASATSWAADVTKKTAEPRYYSVFYNVRIIPNEHTAQASIRLGVCRTCLGKR
jgi:hypothetical protein